MAGQEKITPDLRDVLADMAEAGKRRRMEVVLARTPAAGDDSWRSLLYMATPHLAIEGRLGALVAVEAPTSGAIGLAAVLQKLLIPNGQQLLGPFCLGEISGHVVEFLEHRSSLLR